MKLAAKARLVKFVRVTLLQERGRIRIVGLIGQAVQGAGTASGEFLPSQTCACGDGIPSLVQRFGTVGWQESGVAGLKGSQVACVRFCALPHDVAAISRLTSNAAGARGRFCFVIRR